MKRTLLIFILLLLTEVAIAFFYFHKFIRGFVGDVLVIPLLFYLIRLFTNWRTLYLALTVLGVAVVIEFLQRMNVLDLLQINSRFLQIILGTTFDVKDILAYLTGFLLVLCIEKFSTHDYY